MKVKMSERAFEYEVMTDFKGACMHCIVQRVSEAFFRERSFALKLGEAAWMQALVLVVLGIAKWTYLGYVN